MGMPDCDTTTCCKLLCRKRARPQPGVPPTNNLVDKTYAAVPFLITAVLAVAAWYQQLRWWPLRLAVAVVTVIPPGPGGQGVWGHDAHVVTRHRIGRVAMARATELLQRFHT